MYKAAVIGAGFIGGAHIEALRRLGNVEITALCDELNAEAKAKYYFIPCFYSDYKKMLAEKDIDVVHICTPNNTHYDIVKACIEKGCNFICEKPFTTTVEQAIELNDLARKAQIKGMINFHNRMYPIPNEMKQIVQNGEIGNIFSIHGEYTQDWLLYETDYSWRLNASQVGQTRAVSDIGSHWLDLVEFITGDKIDAVLANFSTVYPKRSKPIGNVETFSKAESQKYEEFQINTEDIATLVFKMRSGAVGSFLVSQVFAGRKNTTVLNIAGSKASISWTSEDLNNLYIGYRDEPNKQLTKDKALMHAHSASTVSYPSGHIEGFPDAFKQGFFQFYESLSKIGEFDYATPIDGLREMQLDSAIYQSNKDQKWINV